MEYIHNPAWMEITEHHVILSLKDIGRLDTYSEGFILTKYRASERILHVFRTEKVRQPLSSVRLNELLSKKAPNLTPNIKNAIPAAW